MTQQIAKRRGPKTPAGKLTVSTNAKTHGIMSPKPVVTAFESETVWREYRKSIIDALEPENGIEQALAERVVLASWRLNRVIAFETERIQSQQDEVIARMEEQAGSSPYREDKTSPAAAAKKVEEARKVYEMVYSLFGLDPSLSREEKIDRYPEAEWIFDCVVEEAVEWPREEDDDEEAISEELIDTRVNMLYDRLDERIDGKESFTPQELRELIFWVAEQAGVPESRGVDGKVAYSPGESLLEKLHTLARYDLEKAEKGLEKVEREIVVRRRVQMLPSESELQKIGRYEAHLSREMYRALHELEALQTRRKGGSAPLGRLDVST
jgi:hypothetical protein